MSDRAAFLRRRQSGIGGSDVGAIVGVDPRRNILDVYIDKTTTPDDSPRTGVLERGIYLEPIVRELYRKRSGRRLKRAQFRRHREHKWMLGHPDSLIRAVDDEHRDSEVVTDQPGILECKTMNYAVLKKTEEQGITPAYQLQCQHYMALCGLPWAAMAILHPDSFRFASVVLEAKPEVQREMIEMCEHFWYNHVVPRKPPSLNELEWQIELPAVEGVVEDRHDEEWKDALEDELARRQMRDEAQELYDLARANIKELCGRHGVFEGAGSRVYFKQRAGRRSLTKKTVQATGLIDPVKLAGWAAETEADYPGLLAVLQASAAELRVDVEDLLTQGKPFEDLRIYHVREE